MRVMVDTNVLVSSILLDSKKMNELFENIFSDIISPDTLLLFA
jgi:predicted nucleic acid-binding protein